MSASGPSSEPRHDARDPWLSTKRTVGSSARTLRMTSGTSCSPSEVWNAIRTVVRAALSSVSTAASPSVRIASGVGALATTGWAQATALYTVVCYAGASLFGWSAGYAWDGLGWPAVVALVLALAAAATTLALGARSSAQD